MTGIPSDFDPATFFSDYPPEFPISSVRNSDAFSDDLLAIHQVQEVQERKFDEEGVVIRHQPRVLGRFHFNAGNIWNSSDPPETPTPNSRPRPPLQKINVRVNNRRSVIGNSPFCSSPPSPPSLPVTTLSDHDVYEALMTTDYIPDSSILEYPSSPPTEVPGPTPKSIPGVKLPGIHTVKRKALPFELGGDAAMATTWATSMKTVDSTLQLASDVAGLGPSTPKRTKPNSTRRQGPFEDVESDEEISDQAPSLSKINLSSELVIAEERQNDPFAPPQPHHDFSLPIAGSRTRPLSHSKQTRLPFHDEGEEEEQRDFELETQEADIHSHSNFGNPFLGAQRVPIRLDTGEVIQIRKKTRKAKPYFRIHDEPTYDIDGNREIKDTYYGIPIHSYLDELAAEKACAEYAKEQADQKRAEQLAITKGKGKAVDNENVTIPLPAIPRDDSKPPCRELLWTEKYRAKRFMDLLGDERTHRQVLRWLKSWEEIVFPDSTRNKQKDNKDSEFYQHKKVLLITGPPGLGKTTLAHVAARQAGYEPLEINASDERTAAVVKGKIRDALSNEGLRIPGVSNSKSNRKVKSIGSGKPVCVIVDEIDGVTGGGSGGSGEGSFISALVDLIVQDQKNSKEKNIGKQPTSSKRKRKNGDENFKLHRPIIAICNDLYAPSLRALRPLAEIVYMRKPPMNLIIGRMKWVFERECVPAEDTAIRRLVELATSGSSSTTGTSAGGDIRCCLVGGEWIAKRLNILKERDPIGATNLKLTRKMVEEELEGREGGRTRGGIRGCVEKVFKKGDATSKECHRSSRSGGGGGTEARNRELDNLREEIECCGEFDKIMSDCFATYLTRPFHDDTLLTKPCCAYDDWLFFHDYISSRVYLEQEFELMCYLSIPALAFNDLFGSSSTTMKLHSYLGNNSNNNNKTTTKETNEDEQQKEPPIYTGLQAEYTHRENLKSIKSIISSFHSTLHAYENPYTGLQSTPSSVRFATTFKNLEIVVTELAPYLIRILNPAVKPVLISSSSSAPSTASVRRDSEKKLVNRAVEVMASVGVVFENFRTSNIISHPSVAAAASQGGGQGGGGGGEWIYRMEPALDTLAIYPTYTPSNKDDMVQTRYATRQVLMQEYKKFVVKLQEEARQARHAKYGIGLFSSSSVSSNSSSMLGSKQQRSKKEVILPNVGSNRSSEKQQVVKKDFFGRPIVGPPPTSSHGHKRRGISGVDGEDDGNEKDTNTKKRVKLNEEGGTTTGESDEGLLASSADCGDPCNTTTSTSSARNKRKGEAKVWVSYHEGVSNAVRKGITIEDLMRGFC